MPFARISLHRGKSSEYLRRLSEELHEALVESFDVPATDRFQVIHQHEVGELIFDRDYLGGPRSETFCADCDHCGAHPDTATKQRFYRRLVERLRVAQGLIRKM